MSLPGRRLLVLAGAAVVLLVGVGLVAGLRDDGSTDAARQTPRKPVPSREAQATAEASPASSPGPARPARGGALRPAATQDPCSRPGIPAGVEARREAQGDLDADGRSDAIIVYTTKPPTKDQPWTLRVETRAGITTDVQFSYTTGPGTPTPFIASRRIAGPELPDFALVEVGYYSSSAFRGYSFAAYRLERCSLHRIPIVTDGRRGSDTFPHDVAKVGPSGDIRVMCGEASASLAAWIWTEERRPFVYKEPGPLGQLGQEKAGNTYTRRLYHYRDGVLEAGRSETWDTRASGDARARPPWDGEGSVCLWDATGPHP